MFLLQLNYVHLYIVVRAALLPRNNTQNDLTSSLEKNIHTVTTSNESEYFPQRIIITKQIYIRDYVLLFFCRKDSIEGFRPEWYISIMIYSRDTPFWSDTLDTQSLMSSTVEGTPPVL